MVVDHKQLCAIHFGAGNIGRGFIGPLLLQSGYHVTFADIDTDVINKANEHREYAVHTLEPKNRGHYDCHRHLRDPAPDVKLVTTSVGLPVLPKIAGPIARGISQRRKAGSGPLNVIACENGVGATEKLREAVFEHLSEEDKKYAKEHVGLANCSVDRIMPPFENDSPLDVGVEYFCEWIVERGPLTGIDNSGTLGIKGMALTDELPGYVERKLFTFNCGHATTAYLGFLKGYPTIFDSIQDEEILRIVEGAMQEGGAALVKKHPTFTLDEQQKYIKRTLDRFRNPNVVDNVKRVGRQPLRELAKNDRLLGPVYTAREYRLPIDNLARGIAAAMSYENDEDEQAAELKNEIEQQGVRNVIKKLTGFNEDSEEFKKIQGSNDVLMRMKARN
ncbi:mannitol-1-phosphate 5-dehydrogenase [Hysterangium stoloniferum]|nr:mannitol-1-phosphate 5-dehydrogenase [Hysterangium stoloniferum]